MTGTEPVLMDLLLRVRDDLARYAQVQEGTEREIARAVREHLRMNFRAAEYLNHNQPAEQP